MNMGISTSIPHGLSVVIAVVDDKLSQIPNIMEMVHFFAVAAVVLFVSLSLLLPRAAKPSKPPPPPSPSPFPLPILGHLHLLLPLGKSNPLHRSLASLASLHGGVLSLRLGSRRALLVSSAAAAAECFSSRDAAFASRPRLLAGKHLGYAYTTLVWAPYGAHWRNLRRIVAVELFSPAQLSASAQIRADEVAELVNALARASEGPDRGVVMKPRLFAMAMNVMMRMIAGKRYYVGGREAGESGSAGSEEEEARRFQEIVEETFAVSGATNLGDFVPLLRVLDYKGLARRLVTLQEKRDKFMQGIVDEHRRMRRRGGDDDDDDDDDRGEEGRKTIIDVLLNLQESDPEYYTDEIIKGVLVVMLSAGTDTSVVTIEWAMALLVSHPDVLEKARAEIDLRVGSGRLVRESDLSDLPYLQCIVKETLRLYPAGPVIPAHESTEDCTVAGFHVPRGTMLLVNAWAIQRDPTNWTEPMQFRPERFLVEREEVDGSMVMLPFGLGRRRCPGEALAMRVVGLAVAALVQCFEWEAGVEGVDMTEGTGLTMPMAKPLVAACRPRTAVIHAQLATTVGAA